MASLKRRLRRPGRRLKQILPSLMLMIGGVIAATIVWQMRTTIVHHSSEFIARAVDAKVQNLPVTGAQYLDAAALQQALELKAGDSLVGYDIAAARTRVEALPWVRLAAVERRLPHTLAVEVYEYQPLARIALADDEWVIDKTGHQIAPTDGRFATLPLIQGQGVADTAASLFALLQTFPNIQASLAQASWVGERRWDLTLQSGITLQLPAKNPLTALETVLELNARRNVLDLTAGEVDLRLPDRVTLRIPPGAEPVPPNAL